MEELQFLMETENSSDGKENNIEYQNNTENEYNKENQNSTDDAAWTERADETISDYSSGRSDQANVIAIYGSSHCLLPFGKNLSTSDPDGCLVSQSLAEKLFGSFPAENQQIIWNGNLWTVRGTLPLPAHCLIVQTAGRTLDLSYNRISILMSQNGDSKKTRENFILEHNLSAHILRFDYLYGWSWLPELIPGKWSDFDGWKENWKKYKLDIQRLKQEEHYTLESIGLECEKEGRFLQAVGLMLCICGIVVFSLKAPQSK